MNPTEDAIDTLFADARARNVDRPAADDRPPTDDRPVGTLVPDAIAVVLGAAARWPSGTDWPVRHGDDPADEWTPHKVLRRVTDHLLDHLAEVDARTFGRASRPDGWAGRTVTTAADRAEFTEEDLAEATQRLLRFADLWQWRLSELTEHRLDERPDETTWTVREITHHVARATVFYADQLRPTS